MGKKPMPSSARTRVEYWGCVEIRDHDEAKTVVFENRSGAYLKYVSTGSEKNAVCRPSWREYQHILIPTG
jgi:hypothetical protein